MHSRYMDRGHSWREMANVGIGSDFKPVVVCQEATRKAINAWEDRHGVKRLNHENRVRRLWQKYKAGIIPKDSIPAVLREHGEEFERFEAEGRN